MFDVANFQTDRARQSRIRFLEVLQDTNRKLSAGLTDEKVLDFLFESLAGIIPFDRIGIAILEDNDRKLRLSWVKSRGSIHYLVKNYVALVKGSSLEALLKTGQPRIINDLEQYLEAHPESISTQLVVKDGIRSNFACPLQAKGKMIGIVFFSSMQKHTYADQHVETFLDIAEEFSIIIEQAKLRKYFESTECSDRTLSEVIHDLRAPLSTIQGYLNMATSEKWFSALSAEVRQVFQVIERNSLHMLNLLDELAELKQARDLDNFIRLEEVELQDFVNSVSDSGWALASRKGLSFEKHISPKVPKYGHFDPTKIRRVLENLLTNAVKFSSQGKITLMVDVEANQLCFSVADQGLGIQTSEQNKLFTEFGKTSTLPTGGESSTGLGLAIVKNIIDAHGGKIFVTSKVNEGSTFKVCIPSAV